MSEEKFDVRDLYAEVAHFILPRLSQFRDEVVSYPDSDEIVSFEHWKGTIDKMIFAFSCIVYDDEQDSDERIDEGLTLFAKWYRHLWI